MANAVLGLGLLFLMICIAGGEAEPFGGALEERRAQNGTAGQYPKTLGQLAKPQSLPNDAQAGPHNKHRRKPYSSRPRGKMTRKPRPNRNRHLRLSSNEKLSVLMKGEGGGNKKYKKPRHGKRGQKS